MNNLPTQYGGARQAPAGAMDVWNQGQANALAVPGPQQTAPAGPSPAAVVQRLLRGRIALAIVLAVIGAICGATAGYMSQAPTYKAAGQISITPIIPMIENDKAYPFYEKMMTSAAKSGFNNQRLLDQMAKTDPWMKVTNGNNDLLADYANGVKATFVRNSNLIEIEYANPDRNVASAGILTSIKCFAEEFKQNASSQVKTKIEELQKRQQEIEAKNDAANTAKIEVTKQYGTTELESIRAAAQTTVEQATKDLRGNESNLRLVEDAIKARAAPNGQIAIGELAAVDPTLNSMIAELRVLQNKYKQDKAMMGANHRNVQQDLIQVDIKQGAINERADELRATVLAIIPDMVQGGAARILFTDGDLKLLRTRVTSLREELAKATKTRDEIASAAAKVAEQTRLMQKYQLDLTQMNERLTAMNYQAASTGTLDVVADGRYASKASDKKILFGLAGAIGGACVPVGLLMLMGLMDTRFRYSDDAAGQAMAGIPLLGILPNLPDRLSDPAQASIAAHCVHQIRTMLQLNSMREHSTAFAITSASSGDGKTSLSLALGLSFAASGSRTLLIDADLIGGGLSSRLGNDTQVGIVDALAGVGLEECVQPTDVADLSLLPIGGAQSHHAGSFSPPAVRKLLLEIRKHYEVIIIDTGPVMGSIEATPVCASVDGVVLTVARGQSRPLVERAITHLASIGARVSGVVFNRAQHKDFEQSIGAISVRSAARSTMNGQGHNRKAGGMGAVATAVAGSVRNEN